MPEEDVEEQIRQFSWSKMQRDVHSLMSTKAWGPRWEELMVAVVAFEESTMWDENALPVSSLRPCEIGQWMKEHRKFGDNNKLESNFGERLTAWWYDIGPEYRKGQRPASYPENEQWPPQSTEGREREEFACVRRSGTNGLLLVILALTWWGQSIVNEGASDGLGAGEVALANHERWQHFLGDVLWMIQTVTYPLEPQHRADVERLREDFITRLRRREVPEEAKRKEKGAPQETSGKAASAQGQKSAGKGGQKSAGKGGQKSAGNANMRKRCARIWRCDGKLNRN